MAKAPPALTIIIEISKSKLRTMAEAALSFIYDEFDESDVKAAGYSSKKMIDALVVDKTFLNEITDTIKAEASNAIADQYSYGFSNESIIAYDMYDEISKVYQLREVDREKEDFSAFRKKSLQAAKKLLLDAGYSVDDSAVVD